MAERPLHQRLWFGTGALASAARLALNPLASAYGAAVWLRGTLYDRGVLPTKNTGLPVLSVGNMTVGGTGKTPVAAWVAANLATRGLTPAVVLRGYGNDEVAVHRALNPGLSVIASADRVSGIRVARTGGADVAILDDGFQHRRAMRDWDIVLVSADEWTSRPRLLPAGPWREPISGARRATLLVVTRKAVSNEAAAVVTQRLREIAPRVPVAQLNLTVSELRAVNGLGRLPIAQLSGRRSRALLSIANPTTFLDQLRVLGADVTARVYPDHHWFSDEEIGVFARELAGVDLAVCTLKDAVKVTGRWPREAPPLWYVSQHVNVERGADAFDRMFEDIVRARAGAATIAPKTAG